MKLRQHKRRVWQAMNADWYWRRMQRLLPDRQRERRYFSIAAMTMAERVRTSNQAHAALKQLLLRWITPTKDSL